VERSRRPPTIIDVARLAGVSKSAVSRALLGEGRVSEATRRCVKEAAEELGYVKNAMAQGLSAHSTRTLGVLVRDPASVFYGRMHQALQRRAAERGYRVVTVTGNLAPGDEARALETLVSLRVDGLVVCSGKLPTAKIELFAGRIPTVVAGRPETGELVGSVYCDERDGGRKLAAHLIGLGHRAVAVMTLPKSKSLTLSVRTAEMARELRRNGIEVLRIPHDPGNAFAGQPGVRVLLDRPGVTAVMSPSDFDALGVLNELRLAGLDVPGQVSVTGYDGIPPLTAPAIGLTTLVQPIDQIAARAVDAVVDMLQARSAAARGPGSAPGPGRHLRLYGELRVGRTTGPARPRA
jgi:DNA-binding LacI/PurR family transcriptional regulator